MRKPRGWAIEAVHPLADYRVFSVCGLQARRDEDGLPYTFYRIDAADWVNVIALTTDERVILVHQYRLGAGRVTLEIPGGVVDEGESAEAAATRELLEETGFVAETMLAIGSINPNPALYANTLHTFLATGCRRVSDVRNDHAEETIVELVPRDDLRRRIAGGEVDHALVLTALHWWSLHESALVPT